MTVEPYRQQDGRVSRLPAEEVRARVERAKRVSAR